MKYPNPYQFNELSLDSLAVKSDVVIKGTTDLANKTQLIVDYFDNVSGSYKSARVAVPRNISRNIRSMDFSEPMQMELQPPQLRNGSYEYNATVNALPDGYSQANEGYNDINDYEGGLNSALLEGDEDTASVSFMNAEPRNGNSSSSSGDLNSMLLG